MGLFIRPRAVNETIGDTPTPPDDSEPVELVKLGGQGLGNARPEPIVIRLTRDVGKRSHRHPQQGLRAGHLRQTEDTGGQDNQHRPCRTSGQSDTQVVPRFGHHRRMLSGPTVVR